MTTFDVEALENLYASVSAGDGIDIGDLQARLTQLFSLERSTEEVRDYRLSRGIWKKLADEISPVSRFLQWRRIDSGRVRFPLDDQPPDCWLTPGDGGNPIGIEVTIAQARERFHLAKELVRLFWSRGFIGVPDDAPQEEFDRAMSANPTMYSTEQAVSAIGGGILRCLRRKNRLAFTDFTVLVQAPLSSLPEERWKLLVDEILAGGTRYAFKSAFVIGNADEAPNGFQIF